MLNRFIWEKVQVGTFNKEGLKQRSSHNIFNIILHWCKECETLTFNYKDNCSVTWSSRWTWWRRGWQTAWCLWRHRRPAVAAEATSPRSAGHPRHQGPAPSPGCTCANNLDLGKNFTSSIYKLFDHWLWHHGLHYKCKWGVTPRGPRINI